MRKGIRIKIIAATAAMAICITGLCVYADQPHTTPGEPVARAVEPIKEPEEIQTVEKAADVLLEPFGPIHPVPVMEERGVILNERSAEVSDEPVEDRTSEENAGVGMAEGTNDVTDESLGDDSGEDDYVELQSGDDDSSDGFYEPDDEEYAEVAEEQCKEPQEEVQGVSEEAPEPQMEYLGQYIATAYCGCSLCCGSSGNATASGEYPISGHTIACNSLPFGTRVMVDGIIYTVEDTGWSPYGDAWIDIYFDTHDEAVAYGMHTVDVYRVIE